MAAPFVFPHGCKVTSEVASFSKGWTITFQAHANGVVGSAPDLDPFFHEFAALIRKGFQQVMVHILILFAVGFFWQHCVQESGLVGVAL